MKPIILVTSGNTRLKMNFSAGIEFAGVARAFMDVINRHGGIPLIVTELKDGEDAARLVNQCDGLLLTSGADISSTLYGEEARVCYTTSSQVGEPFNRGSQMEPDFQRDQMELALYKEARKNDIPVLGICRGMQLINVAEGGTLHQEIPHSEIAHFIETDGWIPYHEIGIEKDSILHALLGCEKYIVPSIHHQAINRLSENLVASAKSADGIIEAVESKDKTTFVLGVQGHIEKVITNQSRYDTIFKQFVERASANLRDKK